MSKITVVLKTAQGSFQLEKGEYTLDANGRLPLKKIMEDWNVKDLVWIEMEEEIKLQSDGYSDMSFSFAAGKTVELSGKVLKKDDNIEKMAQPVATKKAEKITVEASGDYNSRTEKSEEARLLKSLNKGVKNGAKTDETTDSSNAKQKQQEEEAKRVAEAKRKAEWAAKRDAEEKARKEKIEKAKKEEEEKAKKLAADKKLQEEKVKKENEEKAKKLAADKKAAEEKAKKESEEKAKQSTNEKKPIQKTNNESLSLAERKAKAEEDRLLKSMNRRGPSGGGSIFGKKPANKPVNKPVSTQPKQTPVSAAPKPTSQTAQKPVTGPTPAKQPANHYATAPSAVATDIYNHAKVLFAGEGHSHGTVASLTQATLDAAESLDIDEFSKCIKNLYETVAATKQTVLITQARATVRVAQDLAVNAELTCENPDNAAAVDKYSDANETLAKLFADFKQ